LSASGDSILVYAQDDVTADIAFVYGLSTIPWETDLTTPLTSSTSNLPSSLNASTSHASIYFPDSNDNGVYQGNFNNCCIAYLYLFVIIFFVCRRNGGLFSGFIENDIQYILLDN
jgi:hypothetical protein